MSFGSLPSVLGNGGGVAISVIGGKGLFADGTAAAPSISFAADTDTGWYRAAANQIRLALGGNGVLTFTSTGNISSTATGATLLLSDATGAIGLTAAGSAQDITLTPSTTGTVTINLGSGGTTVWQGRTNDWVQSSVGSRILVNFGAATGSTYATLSVQNAGGNGTGPLVIGAGTSLLLNGLTTLGTGVLQFPAATTSAGGITFGSDLNLFRSSAGVLRISSTSNYSTEITNSGGTGAASVAFINTGGSFFVGSDSSSGSALGGGTAYAGVIATGTAVPLIFRTNGTTALTLDSSQRTILSGALRLANAYVAGAVVGTGYVTIQDSTGTTYRVPVLV